MRQPTFVSRPGTHRRRSKAGFDAVVENLHALRLLQDAGHAREPVAMHGAARRA